MSVTAVESSTPIMARAGIDPKPEKAFLRRFQFVEGLGGSASVKKTRSHVTREFYREQRHNDMNQSTKSAPFTRTEPINQSKFEIQVLEFDKKKDGRKESKSQHRRSPSAEEPSEEFLQVSAAANSAHGFLGTTTLAKQRLPSVSTILGAGRIDPFDSFPVKSTYEVAELVDYWYFIIPQFVHRQWLKFFSQPQPCRNLIYIYREDSVTFLSLLHYAAQHMATSKGLTETKATLSYKYKTIHAVNKRIQSHAGQPDDVTVLAVTMMANAERIWGDIEVAKIHCAAMRRMILQRGGFANFQHNSLVHVKVVWSLISLPPAQPYLFSNETLESNSISGSPSCASTDSLVAANAYQAFTSFSTFIRRRRYQIRALQASRNKSDTSNRTQAFQPGSRMFQSFSRSDDNTHGYEDQSNSPHHRPSKFITSLPTIDYMRMACLLYFNLILDCYGDASEKTEYFLSRFLPFSAHANEDTALLAEHLIWSLINMSIVRSRHASTSPPDPMQPDPSQENVLVWQLVAYMDLLKIQSQTTWQRVGETLKGFLVADGDAVNDDDEGMGTGISTPDFHMTGQVGSAFEIGDDGDVDAVADGDDEMRAILEDGFFALGNERFLSG